MAEIVELMTKLRMDSSEFSAKINEAKAQISEFSKTSESSLSSFGFSIGTVAASAVIGLGYEVGKTADKLNSLYETSRKLGTSAGDLQTLESAFKGFGVSGDQVVRMMGFIQKSIGDAELGIGNVGDTFKTLGLNVKELAGMGAADQVQAIATAIGKLKDNTQQMAVARQIAGRGGADLLGAARGDLAGAIKEYKGLQVDDETAENAHKFVEQLNYAEAAMESLGFKLVSKMTGWMTYLRQNFTDLAAFMKENVGNFDSDDKQTGAKSAKLDSLNRLNNSNHGSFGSQDWPGFTKGRLEQAATAPLDQVGYSKIPNFMDGSKVDMKTSAQQIKGLGDEAESAGKKLKDMSETSKLLTSAQSSGVEESLKRILGDDLKPKTISRNSNDMKNPYMDLLSSDMRIWDSEVKSLFENIKQYGDTPQNESQLKRLKAQVSGMDDDVDVGVINDLQKYAKEQGPKKSQIEVTVHWEKGLSGTVNVKDGQGMVSDGVKSVFAQESSGMGK